MNKEKKEIEEIIEFNHKVDISVRPSKTTMSGWEVVFDPEYLKEYVAVLLDSYANKKLSEARERIIEALNKQRSRENGDWGDGRNSMVSKAKEIALSILSNK